MIDFSRRSNFVLAPCVYMEDMDRHDIVIRRDEGTSWVDLVVSHMSDRMSGVVDQILIEARLPSLTNTCM